jgi:ribose 1,5-bisphosphokinase PhnN
VVEGTGRTAAAVAGGVEGLCLSWRVRGWHYPVEGQFAQVVAARVVELVVNSRVHVSQSTHHHQTLPPVSSAASSRAY